MTPEDLRDLLQRVAAGALDVDGALREARSRPAVDGIARSEDLRVDLHRSLRCGVPEAVFCRGKTPEQAARACAALDRAGQAVLATRAEPAHAEAILMAVPEAEHDPVGRTVVRAPAAPTPEEAGGCVGLLWAGTSDAPVAAEARATLRAAGCAVEEVDDCGVAGLHRVLEHVDLLHTADALVVVAGMEGALPGVVAVLTDVPVIGVPTSVGYGASFGGLAALLGMLNACAAGVTTVNIDNGFGAAAAAARIHRARRAERRAVGAGGGAAGGAAGGSADGSAGGA